MELKQALCKLKIVQSLHPEQLNDQNMRGNGAQSSRYQCPGRNEGMIRASGAQNATADEWIALKNKKGRKNRKRGKQKRARLCKTNSKLSP